MFQTRAVPGFTLRGEQPKIIQSIIEAFNQGFQNVILQAPTGTGKSIIGRTICTAFRDAYILTPTKQLQSQYYADFGGHGDFALFKGKANYECQIYEDPETNDPYTVEDAPCQHGKSSQIKRCKDDSICPYYNAMKVASEAQTTSMNFMLHIVWQMLSEMVLSPPFLPRHLHVIDEAHKIEDNVRDFLSIKISEKNIRSQYRDYWMDSLSWWDNRSRWTDGEIGRLPEVIDDENTLVYLRQLNVVNERKIKDLMSRFRAWDEHALAERSMDEKEVAKEYNPCATMRERLEKFFTSYAESASNYGIGIEMKYDSRLGRKERSIQVKPVNVGSYIQSKLLGEFNLFMSATLPMTDIWARDLSLKNYKIIDVESHFPHENRPIFFTTVGRMNKDTMATLTPMACEKISKILAKFPSEKGIIHTPSYMFNEEVKKFFSDESRLLICRAGETEAMLEKHANSPEPTILVSPAMKEGVDLKDDLSRVQIIVKAPFDSLEDPAVKKKMQANPKWYDMRTLMNFMQQYGRSIRTPTDYARTYILDEALVNFIRKNQRFIPRYVLDAIHNLN